MQILLQMEHDTFKQCELEVEGIHQQIKKAKLDLEVYHLSLSQDSELSSGDQADQEPKSAVRPFFC